MEPSVREAFAKRLQELLDSKYRKNRGALAEAVHVSPSALSQYARGRASPSLEVLVELAKALDVSLDYLVLGQESLPYPPDYSYWVGHMEGMVRKLTAQSASLQAFVGRIGADLAREIEASARKHLENATAIGGALTASEAAEVEHHSIYTRIATVDLELDVLLAGVDRDDVTAVPGPFGQTVLDNIAQDRRYSYLIPKGQEWAKQASLFRQLIVKEISAKIVGSEALIDRNVKFYQSTHALVPSFVIFEVQHRSLERVPHLHYQLSDFIAPVSSATDEEDSDAGLVAVIQPMSPHMQSYQLIAQDHVPRLREEYDRMQKEGSPLTFNTRSPSICSGTDAPTGRRTCPSTR